MVDLSLHVLDIVENSIVGQASKIDVEIVEDEADDRLTLTIRDNGKGMEQTEARECLDPFYTTKDRKRVGLGLPLLAQAAEQCGGHLDVASVPGAGTTVTAVFQLSHVDRQPIGDMRTTLRVLTATQPEITFSYQYIARKNEPQESQPDEKADAKRS